jgi:hypothetical protein
MSPVLRDLTSSYGQNLNVPNVVYTLPASDGIKHLEQYPANFLWIENLSWTKQFFKNNVDPYLAAIVNRTYVTFRCWKWWYLVLQDFDGQFPNPETGDFILALKTMLQRLDSNSHPLTSMRSSCIRKRCNVMSMVLKVIVWRKSLTPAALFWAGTTNYCRLCAKVMLCKLSVMQSLPLSMVISIGIELILDMHCLIARQLVMSLASLPIGSQK